MIDSRNFVDEGLEKSRQRFGDKRKTDPRKPESDAAGEGRGALGISANNFVRSNSQKIIMLRHYDRRTFLKLGLTGLLAPPLHAMTAGTGPALPGSKTYLRTCQLFNSRLKPKPAAVWPCDKEQDVIAAIRWATDQAKKISIKSGGHCFEGFCLADDQLAIDLSAMRHMALDPKTKSFTVSPGTTLKQINDFLLPKGRVLPAGSCGGVGIGGLTLGGGYGLLARKYGLTCDQLTGLRMIDAGGQVHDVEGDSPLLKACRGGGNGNFGVITQLRFRTQAAPSHLHRRRFKSANLSPAKVKTLLRAWFEATHELPNDAFSAFVLNGSFLTVLLTHTDLRQRERITKAMKAFESLTDSRTRWFAPLYPSAIETYYGNRDPLPFKNACAGMHRGFDELEPLIEELARRVAGTGGLIWQINTLGGAIQKPEFANASVFAHRDCAYMAEIQGYWEQANRQDRVVAAVDDIQHWLAQQGIKRHYCNYPDRNFTNPQESYYGDLAFLTGIKQQYDPQDRFHHPQGIRP